jgi:Uma2 family endonuclease
MDLTLQRCPSGVVCNKQAGELLFGEGSLMRVDVEKKRFTVDDYYRMGDAGILGPDDRVELINGEILTMSPIGSRHMVCVDRATAVFAPTLVAKKAILSIQNAVWISEITMPQPDVLLLKPQEDYYAGRFRKPADVLLLIEVSDTTLRRDRNVKLPLYAAAGVSEVWIEDLKHELLLVYRDPAGSAYSTCLTFKHGESVSPLALPDMLVSVDDLLG